MVLKFLDVSNGNLMEECSMVWNVSNVILSIKVKVNIMEGIHDESWYFLNNVNYGCNVSTKYVMSPIVV